VPDLSGAGGGCFLKPERCPGAESRELFLGLVRRADDPFQSAYGAGFELNNRNTD
jgi:hypothetical protein